MDIRNNKSTWLKKKYLAYGVIPAFALMLVAGVASAHGLGFGMNNATPEEIAERQTTMFQHQANLLGTSLEEVKNAWAKGQTVLELAQEKGITEEQLRTKMQTQMQEQMKTHLQTLVDKGVITQTQMNQRLEVMKTKISNNQGKGFGSDKVFH